MPKFEWDENKNASNLADHKISFEEAATIFEGPVFTSDDEGSDEEMRERSYGLINGITVICVIHTDRGEATRVICARKKAAAIAAEMEEDGQVKGSMALIDGVRKFAISVRDLNIDLIDRINPFETAYAILSKSMSEQTLKQVHAIIEGKRISLTLEEARELARRALKFKQERGRLPEITSPDAWEKRMAEGIEFLRRHAVGSPNG